MSCLRNGSLWTCQAIGLSGTNGTFTGDKTGAAVDRSGAQWIKLSVDATGGALVYADHGRFYDPAPTNALYYSFPSLMVNCAGDMMLGCSGSGTNDFIGAYYAWRLSNGATMTKPLLLRAGSGNYGQDRWGDYSATTLDPADDLSFWTVQEVAVLDPNLLNPLDWLTTIANLRPHP